MTRFRLLLEWFVILCCALAVAWWAERSDATARVDRALLDRAAIEAAEPARDDILLVAIDDRSLAEIGRWPWDRRQLAVLVDKLTAGGAKGVLLDVFLSEPSTADADEALVAAIRRNGFVAVPNGFRPAEGKVQGLEALAPIPAIATASGATGHVVVEPDSDGVVRRLSPYYADGLGGGLPHVVSELRRLIDPTAKPVAPGTISAMMLRPAASFPTIPAAAVIAGEVPAQFIRDKIVFVGATAPGLGDLFPVSAPAGSMMSGAELQANYFQDLDAAGFIRPLAAPIANGLTAALILLLFLGFWKLRPAYCLILALLLAIITVLIAWGLAMLWQLWFAPGPALLALTLSYPLWGWRRLSAVSGFLDSEAGKLEAFPQSPQRELAGGFDQVARQVSRLDFLISEVSERRAFLDRIVEATPDALCVFSEDGRLLLLNRRARDLFGDPQRDTPLADLLQAVRGQLSRDGKELELADGRIFAIERSTGDAGGDLAGFSLMLLTDITEIRRAEVERRQMLEFLSHDMRSPQVAIMALSQGEDETRLKRIRALATQTMELADQFVQLARLAEVPLAMENADLAALAEEAVDRVWAQAQQAHCRVTCATPDEPVLVRCDPSVIARLLDNLLSNAVKYGGPAAHVAIEARDGTGIAKVSDQGPGLPPERLENPFKRFGSMQSDGKSIGAGLGLAFVKAAVDRHAGTVTCDSSPLGTSFTVSLALASAD